MHQDDDNGKTWKMKLWNKKNCFGGNKKSFSQNFLDIEEETALEMIYLRNYAEAHFQTFLLQIAFVWSTKWKLNFVRDAAR